MIPRITFVWVLSFSSASYVVPAVLYNAKTVSHSNTHVESENQNMKRRLETKNIPYFCFWTKLCWRANSLKNTSSISSISKDSSDLNKSRFGCYFCHSLVNFKNLIILFWNKWVIYMVREKAKEVLCLIRNI